MKNKKIFLSIILFLFILATVNAADNSTKENNDNINASNTSFTHNTHENTFLNNNVSRSEKGTSINSLNNDSCNNTSYNVSLSYKKLKNKSYNFTAKITNFDSNEVKNGTLIFKINRKQYACNIINGVSSLKYNFPDYGQYMIVSSYNGTYDSNIIDLNVNKANIDINIPKKQDITKSVPVNISIEDDECSLLNSKIELYVNNKLCKTKKIENISTFFNITINKLGISTLKVKYISSYNKTLTKSAQINITRKYERVLLYMPKNSKTQKTINLKVKVLNGTEKIDTGKIIIKCDNKKVLSGKLINSSVSFNYTLPIRSGTHNITAEYIKRISLASITKKIKLNNSEKMTFNVKKKHVLFSDYNFIVKITSPYTIINHGMVRLKFNNTVIATKKVVNGSAVFSYTMPAYPEQYKVVASYIKNKKIIYSIEWNVTVYKPYYIYINSPQILQNGSGKMGQITSYTCAPHVLHQILYKFGLTKYSEKQLARIMGTTKDGTSHKGINYGIKYVSKHSNLTLSYSWKSFSSYGKTIDERFKNIAKIISKKNAAVLVHNYYRLKWGHYESIYAIDTRNRQVLVLNSLGDHQKKGYWGYIEKRSYDTFASYIAHTPGGQKSICIIRKK